MKKVFLAFALWLGFSGAAFAMQDTEPSEAQEQNSAEVKILSDGFYKMSAEEYGRAKVSCDASHYYIGCDKIYSPKISQFIKECDFGNGKYSTCEKLLETLNAKCFEKNGRENFEACDLAGEILIKTSRIPLGLERLIRGCEVGQIINSCFLCALTYLHYSFDIDEVIKYTMMTRDLAHNKEHFNKIIKKLQDCKADKECNPAKLEFQ